jgi:hypothetical protein
MLATIITNRGSDVATWATVVVAFVTFFIGNLFNPWRASSRATVVAHTKLAVELAERNARMDNNIANLTVICTQLTTDLSKVAMSVQSMHDRLVVVETHTSGMLAPKNT